MLVGLCSAMVAGAVISCSTDKSADNPTSTSDKVMDSAITGQLDSIIDAAVNSTGIPGAMVGIWGPDGNYVKVAGVADTATKAPMETDFYH